MIEINVLLKQDIDDNTKVAIFLIVSLKLDYVNWNILLLKL